MKKENQNNMKQCEGCLTEISKMAKICPKCGTRNSQPFYKLKRTYVILFLLFMFIGITSESEDDTVVSTTSNTTVDNDENIKEDVSEETSETETEPETEQQIVYTKYDVAQLLDDLSNNALAATEKYEKQYVELTGKLSVIDSKGKYISIEPANDYFSFDSVSCYIKTDEQKSVVSTLSRGDNIIIKGKIKSVGEVFGYSLDIDEISKA